MTLASDLALGLDPVLFARKLGLEPDPWQADLLRSPAKKLLLNCARQTGKSTVAAIMALHEALYKPPALVLLLSPSLRQSSELFRKVSGFYRALGKPVAPELESALRVELENGSRIISLPGKEQTVRGFSGVSLLVVDEAARVPDELYFSVRPMLATSGGKLVLLSTPFGTRGFFFREWRDGTGWVKVKVTARECPRIPPEFLAEERHTLGGWWFRQEYECEFLDRETAAFTYDQVQAAFAKEVEPWEL